MAAKKSISGLQIIMATGSLVGFLGGWVTLGHAPTPALPQATTASVSAPANPTTLQPSASGNLVPLQSQTTARVPRMRTGGS